MGRQHYGRGFTLALVIVIPILLSASVSSASARESVSCYTSTWNGNLDGATLSDGGCFDFDLGFHDSETILSIDISISGDAVDVLLFDHNGAQTYLMGQNYHLALESDPTFENYSGPLLYHWTTPYSLAERQWHLIIDNAAHSGDEGLGDQGGNESVVSINVTTIQRDYFEAYHGMEVLASGSHLQIAGGDELTLDVGTSISISTWPVAGDPDLYLMTETQRENYLSGAQTDTHIASGSLTQIVSQGTMTWIVPQEYDGVTLYIMLDNEATPSGGGAGTATAIISVSVIVNPILAPDIKNDLVFAVSELGETITFDASDSPNRQGQVGLLEWDLDTAVDSNSDGDFTNDVDATGWSAQSNYTTPGVHTVSLKITSPRGEVAFTSSQVTVVDTMSPVISLSHNGATDSDGHALIEHGQTITFTSTSNDGHIVASTRWTVDGSLASNESTLQRSWANPGFHEILLVVSDASGNEATENVTVQIVDGTFPVINRASCTVPVTVTAGESITLIGDASDSWDDDDTLSYHWDLDPLFDGNGDGDMRNDEDLYGSSTGNVFSNVGEQSIVLNVRDEAGNSDKMSFTIQVNPAPESDSIFAIVLVIVVLFLIVTVIGIVGYQKVQDNVAMRILMEKGLTEAEALQRVISVKSSQKLSIFSPALVRAGLDSQAPKTAAQIDFEEKEVLSQQLYGGAQDQNLAFQPQRGRAGAEAELATLAGVGQMQQQASGRVLSDDEFALMAGIESTPQNQTVEPQISTSRDADIDFLQNLAAGTNEIPLQGEASGAMSGGITLPSSIQEQVPITTSSPPPSVDSTQMKTDCASCGKSMSFSFPEGIKEVLIDCPSCGVEQLVGR